MGWYHDANFDWGESGVAAPATCSISNKPKAEQPAPAAVAAAAKAEDSKPAPSGNTACPLPADSAPPPPPPDVDSIFHLCQKSKWEEAVRDSQPYFPPTYMSDGKFTRATVFKRDIVSTANEYYKDVKGEWIVLEIDCKTLFSLGIPILAQDVAPESTSKQPVKCLQVFGGLSTTLPGLVKKIYKIRRSSSDGTFLKVVDPPKPTPKEEEKKEEAPAKEKTRRFWSKTKK
jgi:hypothetical protein